MTRSHLNFVYSAYLPRQTRAVNLHKRARNAYSVLSTVQKDETFIDWMRKISLFHNLIGERQIVLQLYFYLILMSYVNAEVCCASAIRAQISSTLKSTNNQRSKQIYLLN